MRNNAIKAGSMAALLKPLIVFGLPPASVVIVNQAHSELADASRFVWVVWVLVICLRALLLVLGAYDEPDDRQRVDLTPFRDHHYYRMMSGTISMRKGGYRF